MTTVHLTFTSAAPTDSLSYADVVDYGHDMSQGIYLRLGNGAELVFNPMMVFAMFITEEKADDKGPT